MDVFPFTNNISKGNITKLDNESTGTISEEEILGYTLSTIYLAVRTLQASTGIIANLLTIITVSKVDFLWENCTSRFVLSLAFADLTVGGGLFLALIRELVTTTSPLWYPLCRGEMFLLLTSGFGNFYSILFITIDRYIYLTKPLRYVSIVTLSRASISIFVLWCFIIVQVLLQHVFNISVDISKPCAMREYIKRKGTSLWEPQFVLATLIILPLYVKIAILIKHLRRTEPHISHFAPERQAQQREKLKERNMARTMLYVMGTFFGCYIPPLIFETIADRWQTDPLPFAIVLGKRVSRVILWIHCMINPFIYGWKNELLRRGYQKLLCPQSYRRAVNARNIEMAQLPNCGQRSAIVQSQ